MTSTITYIKEWQQALQNEINHLKKYGSNKYLLSNGRLLSNDTNYNYYFDTPGPVKIPVGSSIRLEWGTGKHSGRVLSSEGRSVILAFEQSLGDLIQEAYLIHDPWELLDQLIQRFDEIKKSKTKRLRVRKLMDPSMPSKHPIEKITSNVHELILRSKYNPVTFVWGPPGTGKTYTLARVAANKYFQDKRVLLLSHSNQAVDVLVKEITTFLKKKKRFKEGDVLRYGHTISDQFEGNEVTTSQLLQKQDPMLVMDQDRLIEERTNLKKDLASSFSKRDSDQLLELETKITRIREKIRQKEIQFLKEAYIIGTTLAKAASDPIIYEKEFDVVIVDEASMAYVPQTAFAASIGKRVIICGDFKQLPPIAASRDLLVTKWLKEDIFHRAGVADWVQRGELHPHLFLLKEQRRMHPDISAFTNRFIYHSLVGDHETVQNKHNGIVQQGPFPNRASVLIDTSFMGSFSLRERTSNSKMNLWQLLLSFQVIHEAYIAGAKSIGYVTPFRAQAGLMELLLNDLYQKERSTGDITAATVHRFQGSERDVMVFDTVESEPEERPGMLLTGKDSERLINVAITRTKGKFIHISNRSFIKKHVYKGKTIRKLVDFQEQQGQFITTKEIGKWVKHQHPRLQWMHALKLEHVFEDIDNVHSSILIALPEHSSLTEAWTEKLSKRKARIQLTILSIKEWHELIPNHTINCQGIDFPFIMFDKEILWLGLPIESLSGVKPPFIASRLMSQQVSEYLLAQLINT